LSDKQFHRVDALNKLTNLKNYDRGVGIDLDRNGRVWLGTYTMGIFIYDPETDQVRPLFADPFVQQKVGAENLHIYCDPAGITWVSNWNGKGLYELLPFNPLVKRYFANPSNKDSLSSGMISTILRGPQGKLWIGTADGLNIFDPITEKFEVLRAKDLPGLKGTAIIPLYIDTLHHTAWLNAGSQETFEKYFGMQMYEMDLRTMQCKPVVFKIGAKQLERFVISHTLIRPYEDGIIFPEEVTRTVFELARGNLVANPLFQAKSPSGYGGMLPVEGRYIFLQHGGPLPNSTYEKVDGKWIKTPHVLDTLNWGHIIYSANDKTYWVSLRDELIHYDKDFAKIKSYSKRDGYPGIALNMEFDEDGNLWFLSETKKISRLNSVTGVITTLTEKDGYREQDNYWFAPVAKDSGGNIYIGIGWKIGIGDPKWGLDRIYPERYAATNKASVYLSSLTINQKPFMLPAGLNSTGELTLNYKQNNIRIQTGVIDFYAEARGKIRYKLEKDYRPADWQYPMDNIIRYEDLQPGSYILSIQASNTSGEYIGAVKKISIQITPPLWQTWWFLVLSAIACVGIIYAIILYRSRSLKQQNLQLEEKVMVRTKELNHSLEELRAVQAQLIQSEKMASLGELTSGIAHEIQNPLNFVNNFSELNRELIRDLKAEVKNGNFQEADALADSIEANEEKINHHGKRADGIVKSMLQHSRTRTGKRELTDINALCDEYLRLSYHGYRAKDKSFTSKSETDFDTSLPKINVVPQDIGRVVLNLINNAFYVVNEKAKRSINGYEPAVILGTKGLNGTVEIAVRDNGSGVPDSIREKIFQPFFTTKPTGQGTGLGLSLSYDIVKAHGGELNVETKEGEGSIFTIRLPVA